MKTFIKSYPSRTDGRTDPNYRKTSLLKKYCPSVYRQNIQLTLIYM